MRKCASRWSPLATAGSRTGNALQFYSWGGSQQPVGPQMVEPKWLAWDPQVTLCALAYEVRPPHAHCHMRAPLLATPHFGTVHGSSRHVTVFALADDRGKLLIATGNVSFVGRRE